MFLSVLGWVVIVVHKARLAVRKFFQGGATSQRVFVLYLWFDELCVL